jgi:hypothetical protein
MDDAAAVYLLRADECLAVALEGPDEAHQTGAVEMVLYIGLNRPNSRKNVIRCPLT